MQKLIFTGKMHQIREQKDPSYPIALHVVEYHVGKEGNFKRNWLIHVPTHREKWVRRLFEKKQFGKVFELAQIDYLSGIEAVNDNGWHCVGYLQDIFEV